MRRLITIFAVSSLLIFSINLDCLSSSLPVTTEELILESRDIIHGIITAVRSERDEQHSMIYTFISLEVLHVFKGESRAEALIQIRGGSLGNTGVWVEGQPEFGENEVGMEVIIHAFLRENGNLGIYGGERGVYTINNGVIEQLNMTLDEFKKLVDSLINR